MGCEVNAVGVVFEGGSAAELGGTVGGEVFVGVGSEVGVILGG